MRQFPTQVVLLVVLCLGLGTFLHVRAEDFDIKYTIIAQAVHDGEEDPCGQTDASGNPVEYCRIVAVSGQLLLPVTSDPAACRLTWRLRATVAT